MVNENQIQNLLAQAINVNELVQDGIYTRPRSWGVYEIALQETSGDIQQFRTGNHPIRLRELQSEFCAVKQIAVFLSKPLADQLKLILNHQ